MLIERDEHPRAVTLEKLAQLKPIVRANGTVIGKSTSQWWTGNVLSTTLQPGDTIYVPEKISNSDRLRLFAESAQVLSGLAVAARVAISF